MRAIAFSIALLACREAIAVDAARDAAANFYRGYAEYRAKGGMSGIPDREHLAKLAPVITPGLHRLFLAAKKEQERCAKAFPDEKPPWIEGDIFSSNFEGFTAFRADASRPLGQGRVVAVHFQYVERATKVEWTDRLVLRNEAGRWRVEDVLYRAKFAFTSGFGSNLKASLKHIPAC